MLKSNDIYTINSKNGIEYLTFNKLLEYPEINHAYIFKTNNMSFRLGNNRENMEMVRNNLKKTCDALGFDFKGVARPNYMHTNNVRVIDIGFNEDIRPEERPDLSGDKFPDTDGLITNMAHVPILSTNADCNLIFIIDPVNKVIANVHAGWKGTCTKIIHNAVVKMKAEFGSDPKNLLCFLCPSIRKCHYEVDEKVYLLFKEAFEYTGRLSEIASKGDIVDGEQKYYLDIALPNKILLKEDGVLEENIVDSGICSFCESDKIHSKRAEGDDFGLGAAIIQLN